MDSAWAWVSIENNGTRRIRSRLDNMAMGQLLEAWTGTPALGM
jgi:hypothetical protein